MPTEDGGLAAPAQCVLRPRGALAAAASKLVPAEVLMECCGLRFAEGPSGARAGEVLGGGRAHLETPVSGGIREAGRAAAQSQLAVVPLQTEGVDARSALLSGGVVLDATARPSRWRTLALLGNLPRWFAY